MRKLVLIFTSLCSMLWLSAADPVRAQSVLWVAASGSDANSCAQTSPCASFQGAFNKGSVSQINCLTSGNYGPINITTSLIIDCGTGNIGTISGGSNNAAITIDTSSAATIALRHLSLSGNSSAVFGINTFVFVSGTLVVEDCTIQGFTTGTGISFGPSAGRGSLQVSDSRMLNNGAGVVVLPASNQVATVTLNRVELTGNGTDGLDLRGGVVAGTMRDSVVGGNTNVGVSASANQVFFTIEESSIVANLTAGVETNSTGSVVNVGASTIGANGTGVLATQGSLISFGNNQMSANGANGNFTSTTALR